ncbi:polysaccharide pyruvyl transferase family protein [uncultured Jatrophihabitans sp.]|uniref:polysaccharide pyruvyl transferase family protein n=1 Tax=uncultured Jatrophihabitans sp. TaxID=1610747 RepID=UPI0035CAE9C2
MIRRASTRTPAARWLIVGHFGGANLGDEAMLAGVLHYARAHGVSCAVSVSDPVRAAGVHGPGVEWAPEGLLAVARAVVRGSGIAFCGGTHLHDEFRGRRLAYHWLSLARYAVYLGLARALGRRAVLLGHGVGQLTHVVTRGLARFMLWACDSVTVRDAASREALDALSTKREIVTGFDLAGLLPVGPAHDSTADRIAIAPRLTAEFDLRFWMRACAAAAAACPGGNVLLLPFQLSWPADDVETVRQLSAACRAATGQEFDIVDLHARPAAYAEVLSRCAVVVGARYHAVLLAALHSAPVVIVPYESKLRSLARELAIPDDCIVSAGSSVEELTAAIGRARATELPPRDPDAMLRTAAPLLDA